MRKVIAGIAAIAMILGTSAAFAAPPHGPPPGPPPDGPPPPHGPPPPWPYDHPPGYGPQFGFSFNFGPAQGPYRYRYCQTLDETYGDLTDDGYYHLRLVSRSRSELILDARLNKRSYELTIDRCSGDVIDRERIY